MPSSESARYWGLSIMVRTLTGTACSSWEYLNVGPIDRGLGGGSIDQVSRKNTMTVCDGRCGSRAESVQTVGATNASSDARLGKVHSRLPPRSRPRYPKLDSLSSLLSPSSLALICALALGIAYLFKSTQSLPGDHKVLQQGTDAMVSYSCHPSILTLTSRWRTHARRSAVSVI